MVEYANGLVMLEGDKRMKEATKLYEDAAACEPLDADRAARRRDGEGRAGRLIEDRAMKSATLPLLVALSLCGCASGPSSTSSCVARRRRPRRRSPPRAAPAPPPTPAQQRTAAASTLAVERQWLASWFKGTPVVVAQRPDGAVVVDVPREFCFDPGRDAVKPALAAVLDKVAQSLRRTPIAELHLIAAPGDASGSAALGAAAGDARPRLPALARRPRRPPRQAVGGDRRRQCSCESRPPSPA